MNGGEILLIVDVEHTVWEDGHTCGLGEGVGQRSSRLESSNKGRRVGHDSVVGHHVRGCIHTHTHTAIVNFILYLTI